MQPTCDRVVVPAEACDCAQHMQCDRSVSGRVREMVLTAVLVSVAACIGAFAKSVDGRLQRLAVNVPPELVYLPPSQFLRAVTLGYEHVLANVLWFRTISYFGQHYHTDRAYPWLAHMCQTVSDLDPSAEDVYRFGGVILLWEADRVDEGIALLEKGARNLPDLWRLHYVLGFSYYFFKDDVDAASGELAVAARLPDTPPAVTRLAAVIYAAKHGAANAVDFLDALDHDQMTPEMRSAIRERIRDLTLARDLDTLEAAVRSFQGREQRLPHDLHELVSAGIVSSLPAEPFGGQYALETATGRVHTTSGHTPSRLASSPVRAELLRKQARAQEQQ